MLSKIGYITFNGKIPSSSANSVGVMKMCGEFSKLGYVTELILPRINTHESLNFEGTIFEYYGISKPFNIHKVFNPFGLLSKFVLIYSLILYIYSILVCRVDLIITRNIEVAIWAGIFKTPTIFESHNFSKVENHYLLPKLVSLVNNKTGKLLIVVTTLVGKQSYINKGVNGDAILVASNATDVDKYRNTPEKSILRSALNLPELSPIVAFSGSFNQGKGLEQVLECANLLQDVIFIIVGGKKTEVDYYKLKLKSLKQSNVIFFGHVTQFKLPEILCAADILLLPNTSNPGNHSKDYTSPMKMFDYLAAGKPIVATNFPVFKEVLTDGQNAIFVKPDSGVALAKGIMYALENPDLCRRISSAAKVASEKYSWSKRAQAITIWVRNKMKDKSFKKV